MFCSAVVSMAKFYSRRDLLAFLLWATPLAGRTQIGCSERLGVIRFLCRALALATGAEGGVGLRSLLD
jgi:hypothetical protein